MITPTSSFYNNARNLLVGYMNRMKRVSIDSYRLIHSIVLYHVSSSMIEQLRKQPLLQQQLPPPSPPLSIREILLQHATNTVVGNKQQIQPKSQDHEQQGNTMSMAPQTPNQVAIQLLLWDKELALIRYHGIVPYSQQKFASFLSSLNITRNNFGFRTITTGTSNTSNAEMNGTTTTTVTTTNSNNHEESTIVQKEHENEENPVKSTVVQTNSTSANSTSHSPLVAKVAFMITASMRNELTTRLEYSPEEIKTMTPLEASLILQNNVSPTERDSGKVQLLLQLYKEQQQLQQLQQKKGQEETNRSIVESEKMKQRSIPSSSSHQEKQQLNQSTNQRLWYEVIEVLPTNANDTNDNTSSNNSGGEQKELEENSISSSSSNSTTTANSNVIVIGLYQTLAEAQSGLETYQDLASRQHKESFTTTTTAAITTTTTTPATKNNNSNKTTFEIRETWR